MSNKSTRLSRNYKIFVKKKEVFWITMAV